MLNPFKAFKSAENFSADKAQAVSDLESARTVLGETEMRASLEPTEENKSARDKAIRAYREAELAVTRTTAKAEAFQREEKRQLEVTNAKKKRADWEKTAMICKEAVGIAAQIEKEAGEIAEKFLKLLDLTRQAHATAPETDGTLPYDSLLSDGALLNGLKLELRRCGIKAAHPWFKGETEIPKFSNAFLEGAGWLIKKAPDEVRLNGPWSKFFAKK